MIVWIDTEMDEVDIITHVYRATGGNKDLLNRLHVYALRSRNPKDRVALIKDIIANTQNVGVVIIDGIRDCVNDINNPEEATETATMLLSLTEQFGISIITVLHQNKSDNNARGHLGTETVNKAESVLSVEKDGDISIVSPEYCRSKEFQQFAFGVNDNGEPFTLGEWQSKEDTSSKKHRSVTPRDIELSVHKKHVKDIYSTNTFYSYRQLQDAIINALDKDGVKIGDNKARLFIDHYLTEKLIIKDKVPAKSWEGYYVNSSVLTA